MPEHRVAVGAAAGRRSTVWKFVTQGDEAYILGRMFGNEAKVSLHSSGQCQWSATGDWVKKAPDRRNADRHFKKWQADRPTGNSALHAFRIRIPASELRPVEGQEDLEGVTWLAEPAQGETTAIDCYISPVVQSEPRPAITEDRQYLFSLPLSSGRWLVVFETREIIEPASLEQIRHIGWEDAKRAGVAAAPNLRAVAFVEWETPLRGLIELCPPNAV